MAEEKPDTVDSAKLRTARRTDFSLFSLLTFNQVTFNRPTLIESQLMAAPAPLLKVWQQHLSRPGETQLLHDLQLVHEVTSPQASTAFASPAASPLPRAAPSPVDHKSHPSHRRTCTNRRRPPSPATVALRQDCAAVGIELFDVQSLAGHRPHHRPESAFHQAGRTIVLRRPRTPHHGAFARSPSASHLRPASPTVLATQTLPQSKPADLPHQRRRRTRHRRTAKDVILPHHRPHRHRGAPAPSSSTPAPPSRPLHGSRMTTAT